MMKNMQRRLSLFLFCVSLLAVTGVKTGFAQRILSAQQRPIAGYRSGELIVKIRNELPSVTRSLLSNSRSLESRNLDALNQQFGVTSVQPVFDAQAGGRILQQNSPLNNVLLLNLAQPGSETAAAQAYASLSEVEYAELNYLYYVFGVPNDPFVNSQYGLYSGNQGINAFGGWDIERGNNSVIIAIVDTGVDYTHQDLAGKVIKGYDFVNGDYDPIDDNGHGTHVAGIAGALTNNGVGVAGVCQGCSILAVKVISADGSGANSWIANGIANAVNLGANIINLSLGGLDNSSTIRLAVQQATQQGALVVAASGNDGSGAPLYPAALPEVLAVGATTQSGDKASFSNYGNHLALAAPGEAIYSTLPNNRYDAWNGTSMASPHVAGLAGLLLSRNRNLTNSQLRQIMIDTAQDLGAAGRDTYFGYGKINVATALSQTPDSGGNYESPGTTNPYPETPGVGICGRGLNWFFGMTAMALGFLNFAGYAARRKSK